jgi:hypothetical protein
MKRVVIFGHAGIWRAALLRPVSLVYAALA